MLGAVRRVSAFVLALAIAMAGSSPSFAQTDTGLIVLTVTDAKTGKPLSDARAILVGPQTASSLTGASGVIRYTDAPSGIYRLRVVKSGYQAAVSQEFEVLSGREVQLAVKLSGSVGGPAIIGTVVARSAVSVSSNDISDDSPIRRISDSLTDALDKLAGVSVTQDATDPNSAQTISLNGHDESQTAVTLDGIPLGAPGSAVNLRSVNTDLFHGSSVSFSPTAGSLGGGVNFRTLQPTQTWIETLSGSYGTYDRATYDAAATGSIGNLGIAVEHTFRDGNTPLTFQSFIDQSGLTYPHGGESHNTGDFFKLRYTLGDQRTTVSATGLDANNWNASICTQFTGPLPCGYGPNNNNYGSFKLGYFTVQSLVGEVTATVSAYGTSNTSNADFVNRYVNGVPSPSLTVNASNTRGVAYSFAFSPGHHTITLSGNTYASLQTTTPVIGAATTGGTINFQTPFTNAVSADTYQLGDAYKLNNWVTLTPNVSLADTTGVGTSILYGGGVTWRPQKNDAIALSAALGSSQPGTNVNRSFSDPNSARIDCSSGVVTVSGPGDQPQHQSAVNADLSWIHQFRTGQFSLELFRQTQAGQLITALVNQSSEPPNYFPSGYFSTIGQIYNGAFVCGASAVFNPANVYVQQPIGNTARLYQGMNFSGRFSLGRNVVALPTYSLNEAVLTQADALLMGASSTTIVGAQLPNRPIHRAGLTVDGLLGRTGTELLANVQYTGANNQQNLPPYAIFTAGASHRLGPGLLTAFESNIFNTFGYNFASDSYGVPIALNGGGFLQTTGRPLAPRQLNFSYTLKVGAPPPGAAIRTVAQAPQSAAPASTPRPFRLNLATPPPGVDPLSVATARTSCSPDDQKLAAPVLAQIRAYVQAYEAKQTPPQPAGLEIVPHASGNSYYLEIRARLPQGAAGPGGPAGPGQQRPPGGFGREGPGGAPSTGIGGGPILVQSAPPPRRPNNPAFATFRAFFGCAYLTALSVTDAQAKGIAFQRGRPAIYYAPGTGLFVVRPPQPPQLPQGGGSLGAPPSPEPAPSPQASAR